MQTGSESWHEKVPDSSTNT